MINSTLGNFELPANGYLILEKTSPAYTYNPKYDQAANFGSFYFNPNEVDLSDAYKALLNITSEALIRNGEVIRTFDFYSFFIDGENTFFLSLFSIKFVKNNIFSS